MSDKTPLSNEGLAFAFRYLDKNPDARDDSLMQLDYATVRGIRAAIQAEREKVQELSAALDVQKEYRANIGARWKHLEQSNAELKAQLESGTDANMTLVHEALAANIKAANAQDEIAELKATVARLRSALGEFVEWGGAPPRVMDAAKKALVE